MIPGSVDQSAPSTQVDSTRSALRFSVITRLQICVEGRRKDVHLSGKPLLLLRVCFGVATSRVITLLKRSIRGTSTIRIGFLAERSFSL